VVYHGTTGNLLKERLDKLQVFIKQTCVIFFKECNSFVMTFVRFIKIYVYKFFHSALTSPLRDFAKKRVQVKIFRISRTVQVEIYRFPRKVQ
jgi:hypothetical protein